MSDELNDEDDVCTCDATGEDGCPVHYPIDDGADEEDCIGDEQ